MTEECEKISIAAVSSRQAEYAWASSILDPGAMHESVHGGYHPLGRFNG